MDHTNWSLLLTKEGNTVATNARLTPQQLREAQKLIHNGKVYVSFGGHIYDADGKLEH